MSKKIRTGHLSLDPYEHAIVVEYEVTITDLDTGEVRKNKRIEASANSSIHGGLQYHFMLIFIEI